LDGVFQLYVTQVLHNCKDVYGFRGKKGPINLATHSTPHTNLDFK
jgi:hypothetical protein